MAKANIRILLTENKPLTIIRRQHSHPTQSWASNTPEKIVPDLKAYLMIIVEDIKKDFNNSLKEIQENTAKQVEDLKEEAQKSIKELQENTTKQVMELNKTIQDLKREVDTIKKKLKVRQNWR
jgi:predicted RecB family endonuclease